METDLAFKLLFRKYAADLLSLAGDEGATVLSAEPRELQEIQRSVDCVLELRRGRHVYYRHFEFQGENDPTMAERCFRYNALLHLQLHAPVLTTVLYLFPPGPSSDRLVYRVRLGRYEILTGRFHVVRLWTLEAERALRSGAPGLVALVPLMAGGNQLETIRRALNVIEKALPGEPNPDALGVLHYLAGRHYTVDELTLIFRKHAMMIKSSVGDAFFEAGITKGRVEGRLQAERELCLRVVAKHHPTLIDRATAAIEACEDPARLSEWILGAPDHDAASFARLLGLE